MRIHEAVQTIIALSRELNQAMLARRSGVNPGQLSRWVRDGSNLGRNKQGELVAHLLGWYETLHEKRKGEYRNDTVFAQALQLLERFEPYRTQKAVHAPLDPLHPVAPRHSAFVSRPSDEILASILARAPHGIALVGGPRTGKSSQLFWCRESYGDGVRTLLVDCRDLVRQKGAEPSLDLFYRLNAACEEQSIHPFPISLRDPADMPRWIQQSLLGPSWGQVSAVLMLDNLDALSREDLRLLGLALNGLAGAIRGEPVLRRFSLVMAYDEASAEMLSFSQDYASSYYRAVQTVPVCSFPDGGLKSFFQRVLDHASPHAVVRHSEVAWQAFAGHPYLTSQFACLLRDGMADHAAVLVRMGELFDQQIMGRIRDQWRPDLLQRVAQAFLHGHRQDGRITIRTPTVHGIEIDWLADTGLFRLAGLQRVDAVCPPQPGAMCVTPWIETQLHRFFQTLLPSGEHADRDVSER